MSMPTGTPILSNYTTLAALLSALGIKDQNITPVKNGSDDSIYELIKSIISANPDRKEPFYVLDIGAVVDLYRKWINHLNIVEPFFAVKCNPEPALIAVLAALGTNFDCASRAEIDAVLSLGVSAERIIYANPCKAESHVSYSATTGVNLTTFDSVYELEKMSHYHPRCNLLLRIAPPVNTGVRRSLESKYGAFPSEIGPLLQAAKSMNLSVVGVSFHIGISATVFETFDAAIQAARSVFDLANQIGGTPMTILNLGGGFTAGDLLVQAGKAIKQSVATHFGDWANLRVIAEPGRYFAETAATLATCIIGKRIRGKKREYWVNDGIYGSMSCIKMDAVDVSMLPLEKPTETTKLYNSTVFGPTCDALDILGAGLQLPEMEVGDWMVSPNMGAYAKAMGSNFNGFSTPAIPVHLANFMNNF